MDRDEMIEEIGDEIRIMLRYRYPGLSADNNLLHLGDGLSFRYSFFMKSFNTQVYMTVRWLRSREEKYINKLISELPYFSHPHEMRRAYIGHKLYYSDFVLWTGVLHSWSSTV